MSTYDAHIAHYMPRRSAEANCCGTMAENIIPLTETGAEAAATQPPAASYRWMLAMSV